LKEGFLQRIVGIDAPSKKTSADHEKSITMRREERQKTFGFLQGNSPSCPLMC